MSEVFRLMIPGTPQRWKRAKHFVVKGRSVAANDKEMVAYQAGITAMAKRYFGKRPPWTGPVVVSMVAVFAIPESWPAKTKAAARAGRVMHIIDPDIDNIYKAIGDALRGVVYVDDNQVCGFAMPFAKRYGSPPRIELALQLLDQDPDAVTPGQRRLEKQATQGSLFDRKG